MLTTHNIQQKSVVPIILLKNFVNPFFVILACGHFHHNKHKNFHYNSGKLARNGEEQNIPNRERSPYYLDLCN